MNSLRQLNCMAAYGLCVTAVFFGAATHAAEPALTKPTPPVSLEQFLATPPEQMQQLEQLLGITSPGHIRGVTVVPLDQLQIPDVFREQTRAALRQMKEQGYEEAGEDEVSYIDRAMEDKEKLLKPFNEVKPVLKVIPANLDSPKLRKVTLLGSMANGAKTAEGWTALTRLFRIPGLGVAILQETDYIAAQGGMAIAKESINYDVNGYPATLSVKESPRSKKGISELVWANDRKWYILSVNRALKNQREIDDLLSFARGIEE